MGIAKRKEGGGSGSASLAAAPGVLTELYPRLADRLTDPLFEDGTPRRVDTLLVFGQDGVWKAVLRDREANLCLWVSSPAWDEILAVLEDALGDEHAVWRADRAGGAAESTRKKSGK